MINPIIDAVKRFQEYLLDSGLSRSVLALPAPRTLLLSAPDSAEAGTANGFALTITEPEIVNVSKDLFASGHYSFAVQEAFKALDDFIAVKAGPLNASGTALMDQVFSPNNPILYWTRGKKTSREDVQKGYHRLFTGAMLGVRNPVAHEFNWVEEADVALELLVLAQHLVRQAKSAETRQR